MAGLIVPSLAVGVATNVKINAPWTADGIIGFKALSWPSCVYLSWLFNLSMLIGGGIAEGEESTFIGSITPKLPEAIFAVDLIPSTGVNAATIEFGHVNTTKLDGDLSTAPVKTLWIVDDVSFAIGSAQVHLLSIDRKTPFTHSMFFGKS